MRKEVNALYRELEIDIDGVFKVILRMCHSEYGWITFVRASVLKEFRKGNKKTKKKFVNLVSYEPFLFTPTSMIDHAVAEEEKICRSGH